MKFSIVFPLNEVYVFILCDTIIYTKCISVYETAFGQCINTLTHFVLKDISLTFIEIK